MDFRSRSGQDAVAREVRRLQNETKKLSDQAKREADAANRRLRAQQLAVHDEALRKRIDEQRAGQQNYAQVVLLLGYGGYFTLWIQTRDLMSLWLFGWTGSMLGLSILVFVSWELIKALFEGRGMNQLALGEKSIRDYNDQVLKLNSWWHIVFGVAVVAGLAGGIPLLCWYIYIAIRAAAALPVVLPGN